MKLIGMFVKLVVRLIAALSALAAFAMLGFFIAVLFIGGAAGQPLGQVWFQHDPFLAWTGSPSIQLVQVFFERKLSMPFLWDPGVVTLLNWPAAIALLAAAAGFAVIAALLFALTRLGARA